MGCEVAIGLGWAGLGKSSCDVWVTGLQTGFGFTIGLMEEGFRVGQRRVCDEMGWALMSLRRLPARLGFGEGNSVSVVEEAREARRRCCSTSSALTRLLPLPVDDGVRRGGFFQRET